MDADYQMVTKRYARIILWIGCLAVLSGPAAANIMVPFEQVAKEADVVVLLTCESTASGRTYLHVLDRFKGSAESSDLAHLTKELCGASAAATDRIVMAFDTDLQPIASYFRCGENQYCEYDSGVRNPMPLDSRFDAKYLADLEKALEHETAIRAAWRAIAESEERNKGTSRAARKYAAEVLSSRDAYRIRALGRSQLKKAKRRQLGPRKLAAFLTAVGTLEEHMHLGLVSKETAHRGGRGSD